MHGTNETEADTRGNHIDPVFRDAGWGVVEGAHVHRELICPGRILAGGQRGSALWAGYVLSYRGRKLAMIEAKRAGLGHTTGVGQAKDSARRLKARFAYATNGIGWYGIDMHAGTEGDIALPFPTPSGAGTVCAVPQQVGLGFGCWLLNQVDLQGRGLRQQAEVAEGEGVGGVLAPDRRAVHAADGAHAGGADDLIVPRLDRVHAAAEALAVQCVEKGVRDRQAP